MFLWMKVRKEPLCLELKENFQKKAFSSDYSCKDVEDLKMIGISSIDSFFSKIMIDEKGTEEESTLARRRPIIRRVKILLGKLIKVGLKRSRL